MAACVERRAACGASYNACASGATPCKFETQQPARPAGKATADRQFQRRVGRRELACAKASSENDLMDIPWRSTGRKTTAARVAESIFPIGVLPRGAQDLQGVSFKRLTQE